MTDETANLYTAFVARCANPDKTFIKTQDGRRIRYREAFDLAGQIANVLKGNGVKPLDRVAVQVEKSAEALILYLACLRVGAIYLPLNTAYTLSELDYFIGDAEPRVVVCRSASHEAIQSLMARLPGSSVLTLGAQGDGSLMEAARTASTKIDAAPCGPDDVAAILYTSGTTGRSKGAMLTHRNLHSNAATLADAWCFTADDVLLHALPLFHTHGLFVATNIVLMAGASMILLPKFDPVAIREKLPQATVMMGVPTFYTRLLQEDWLDAKTVAHMRLFVSGSAPLLADTHREWSERTGHAILERYGMTETNMITSNPYSGSRIPGTVGAALPGIEVIVTDPQTGVPLPHGDVGMVEVRGPNVFKGYWRMPEKTEAELRSNGFFITGDLGKLDDNGVLSIVGRGKDLVITGGYNVYPKEVETQIDAIDGVIESAVIGVPHPDFGEGVTAIVVKAASCNLNENAIVQVLDSRLAKFKLPKRIIFVDELPRNTMGKVLKEALRTQYKSLYTPG